VKGAEYSINGREDYYREKWFSYSNRMNNDGLPILAFC
jgi:hypothetical protein